MKTKIWILGGAAIAALIGATILTSVPSSASTPSSPAEQAATAELNRTITANNATADEHYRLLEAQYQEQKRQNDIAQQQYQARLQSYQDNRDR
jgi:capsule polysaccharide export protein KpsE/RkpR